MPSLQPPNRYIIAISSLLVIFAISIIVAVKHPYVDYYAQDVSSASVDTIEYGGGASVEVGAVGGSIDKAGMLVDDASSGAVSDGTAIKDTLQQTINSESAETNHAEDKPVVKTTSQGDKEKAPVVVDSVDLSTNNNHHQSLFDHQHEDAKKTNNNNNNNNLEEKESCISLLQQVNVHSNNIISHTEYITFLNNLQPTLHDEIFGDGFAGDTIINYDDLPIELQSNFDELSCQCTFGLCCSEERGIYTVGDGILENVCMKTLEALKDVIG